ncbi:MAG: queuosine salvage family protein [Solirubrobacteraceae bacterium]
MSRSRSGCAWHAPRWPASAAETDSGQHASGPLPADAREAAAAHAICLNAINFGSGWWPTIRKRPGHSGYETMAAGVRERFSDRGPWSAVELVCATPRSIASVLGQDSAHPLMVRCVVALADVGAHVLRDFDGSFAAVVDAARGSVSGLTGILAGWVAFADSARYRGRAVPLFKRAQLAAADAHSAGLLAGADSARLTAFADNLVPHVLRIDGLLVLDPELRRRIDAEQLLEPGSPQEVELRACAVHAVELLCDALDRRLQPSQIDKLLWNRGAQARYKAVPRPRCRTTAY